MSTNASSSKYSSISASSFVDLKGELSKQEALFKKSNSSSSDPRTIQGGNRKAKSKVSIFNQQNKGSASRNEKDKLQWEADPKNDSNKDSSQFRDVLARKAVLYDKIRKGKAPEVNESQRDNLLVDFERKDWEAPDSDESNSEPEVIEDDPIVEWTDEFGRTRQIPQSQVPTIVKIEGDAPPNEHNIHYGDQYLFPVYAPDPTLLAARAAAYAASKAAPLLNHYDASLENRSKAAGFYAFSEDETIRKDQMEGLKREREETEKKRVTREQKEGEGITEREKEKIERKRKIEEKRKELEKKRTRLN